MAVTPNTPANDAALNAARAVDGSLFAADGSLVTLRSEQPVFISEFNRLVRLPTNPVFIGTITDPIENVIDTLLTVLPEGSTFNVDEQANPNDNGEYRVAELTAVAPGAFTVIQQSASVTNNITNTIDLDNQPIVERVKAAGVLHFDGVAGGTTVVPWAGYLLFVMDNDVATDITFSGLDATDDTFGPRTLTIQPTANAITFSGATNPSNLDLTPSTTIPTIYHLVNDGTGTVRIQHVDKD